MQCLLLQKKLDLRLLQTIFSRWNLLQSYQKMSLKKLPVAVGLSISVRRKWTHAKWAARITQSSESPPRNLIQYCHIIFIRFNSKFGFRSKLCYRIGKDFSLHSNDPVRLSWIPRTVKPTASWMYQLFWLLLNSKVTVYSHWQPEFFTGDDQENHKLTHNKAVVYPENLGNCEREWFDDVANNLKRSIKDFRSWTARRDWWCNLQSTASSKSKVVLLINQIALKGSMSLTKNQDPEMTNFQFKSANETIYCYPLSSSINYGRIADMHSSRSLLHY